MRQLVPQHLDRQVGNLLAADRTLPGLGLVHAGRTSANDAGIRDESSIARLSWSQLLPRRHTRASCGWPRGIQAAYLLLRSVTTDWACTAFAGSWPLWLLTEIEGELSDIRRKPSSFEEYWLASKAWEGKGLPLGAGRALANAGFLTVDDLQSADALELASIPRIGRKSLAILYGLMGRTQRPL